MKYLSVCSGIEAATTAWHGLGWEPVGFSEIEQFPSAVLAHHYPDVPNLGDMTKYKEWNIEPGSIGLLVGGTPCQSFSIAGLRKGLEDPRGNLMLTYGAIANHFKPRWILWENVPGVLSSNGGRDFGTFLGMLAELGYGFAYRVLDAQYVRVESHPLAVPQRRRRVFVVGYLGDWRRAASVLFESESLSRYTPPSRKAGERVAGSLTQGFGARGVDADQIANGNYDISPALRAKENTSNRLDSMAVVAQPYKVGNCLTQRMYKGLNSTLDEGQTPILEPIPITDKATRHEGKTGKGSGNCLGIGEPGDPSPTLTAGDKHVVAFPERMSGTQCAKTENVSSALMSENPTAVAFAKNSRDEVREMEVPGALAAQPGMKQQSYLRQGYRVRRLTPEECERLQGFPTGWTRIPWRNKYKCLRCGEKFQDCYAVGIGGLAPAECPCCGEEESIDYDCPDGPRYKAIGNSMAVNVMRWIGERIHKQIAE